MAIRRPQPRDARRKILYKDLGAGGVDHEAIWAMLQAATTAGSRSISTRRPNEGEGSVDDKIGINCRYLTETLKVPHF
ncbi:MAG: hypothetical protein R2867_41450 [Caldilineaceae bacterium]